MWDAITGAPLHSFQHKHVVKTVDWSPDSKRLATGGNEGIMRIFDITHPEKAPLEFVQSKDEVGCTYNPFWVTSCCLLLTLRTLYIFFDRKTISQNEGGFNFKM